MAAGRPSELTPQVLEDVRRILPVCLYIETVADYLSLDRTTVRKWLRRGSIEHKRLARSTRAKEDPKEALYKEFFLVYKKALAEGLISDLGIIKRCADRQPVVTKRTVKRDGTVVEETRYSQGEWTAAAWRSGRRFPELWSPEAREMALMRREMEEMRKQLAAHASQPTASADDTTAADPRKSGPQPA